MKHQNDEQEATALEDAPAAANGGTRRRHDINEQLGRAAAQSLSGKGSVTFLRLDVTSEQSVADARAAINDKHEALDILINAAGWSKVERFVDTTPDLWRRLIDLNYVGVLNVTHAFLPQMIARNRGKIVHVASDAARAGSGGEAVYSGTKGAVVSFTKALARETARYTINVNCVCPGIIHTSMLERRFDLEADREEAYRRVSQRPPVHYIGNPEDVAAAIAYLAADESRFVTGSALTIDGGVGAA